jgi:hypothetical protein
MALPPGTAPPAVGDGEDGELGPAIRLLQGVLQAEGVSPEEIDARLGDTAGATAAFLTGGKPGGETGGQPVEERRRRLRAILEALELAPEVFFGALRAPSLDERRAGGLPAAPLFDRLAAELALAGYGPHPADGRSAGRAGGEPAGQASRDPEELERRLREAIRGALADEGSGPGEPAGPRRRRG